MRVSKSYRISPEIIKKIEVLSNFYSRIDDYNRRVTAGNVIERLVNDEYERLKSEGYNIIEDYEEILKRS